MHLALDSSGSWLLIVNHSGSVVALPLASFGELGSPAGRVELTGTPGPHRSDPARSTTTSGGADSRLGRPRQRALLVPDKGLDVVVTLRLDVRTGALTTLGRVRLRDGSGPRHIALAADGSAAYTIDELACTVSVFTVAAAGRLAPGRPLGAGSMTCATSGALRWCSLPTGDDCW